MFPLFDPVGLVAALFTCSDVSVSGSGCDCLLFSAAAIAGGGFTAVNNPFGIGFLDVKADAPPGGATGRSVTGLPPEVDVVVIEDVAAFDIVGGSPCRGAC